MIKVIFSSDKPSGWEIYHRERNLRKTKNGRGEEKKQATLVDLSGFISIISTLK